MTAYAARPAIVLGKHNVTTDMVTRDLLDQGTPKAYVRIAQAAGVRARSMTRPLDADTVGGTAKLSERNTAAFADALELAVQASRQALDNAGLAPDDVACIITSHTTSWTVPNLDVALVHALGLRSTVRRIAMAAAGCAGGAEALNNAADQVTAHRGGHVLIVVAECLSAATYNPAHTSLQAAIYKGLFGDSAAAVVVSDTPTWGGPAVEIGETFTYLLPNSAARYEGTLTPDGLGFTSTRDATRALVDCMPAILTWLDDGEPLEFAVVHPGGPRILEDAAKGFGFDADHENGMLRHSWECLRSHGNLGGAAVLDVLAAHFDEPPADGATGIIIGFGPGFAVAAQRCRWKSEATLRRVTSRRGDETSEPGER